MRVAISHLAAATLLLAAAVVPVRGQTAEPDRLEGRVVLGGAGVANVPVSLHRVTPDSSGVLVTARSGPDGEFGFPLRSADSASFTVFFVTADHLGVRYFGDPVHPGDSPDDYVVEVRDTTSEAAGALRVARRDVVLVPHADGGWEVNEVVRLRNSGGRTLVSRGGMPTWEMEIPAGAEAFEAGAGDLPTEQVRRMGDRVLLVSPVVPGDRELFLRYRIPAAGRAELGPGTEMDSMNVFVQQPSPRLTISSLRPVEVITVEGRRYLQLSGASLPAESRLRLEWESAGPPVDPIVAGVGAAVLLVLVGAGAAVRNRAA